jgi:hypothetical protein
MQNGSIFTSFAFIFPPVSSPSPFGEGCGEAVGEGRGEATMRHCANDIKLGEIHKKN